MPRIEPVLPPYDAEDEELLTAMMPPGVPPIALFRTFVRNRPMTAALRTWGGYELGPDLSLSMREREIVIDRTCARCEAEYEWSVHVAFFADRVGLDEAQLRSLTAGSADDACWREPRERLLIDLVDSLHETADVDDDRWRALAEHFSEAELLDALLLCGWYHAISFVANGARVALEPGLPRFADVA